jgi:putative DNA primase/helicase
MAFADISLVDEFAINSEDTTAQKTWKLSRSLLRDRRFYTASKQSYIWLYDPDTGIWRKNGEEYVMQFVARALGEHWKAHDGAEVVAAIRAESYDPNVSLDSTRATIVVQNGTLNVETGEFQPSFKPEEYHIAALPITYEPAAQCPAIGKFLMEVLASQDDALAMEELFGYCLWKTYPYALITCLLGAGENGKSTLLRLLRAFLGSDNVSGCTPQEIVTNRFRAAQLHGKLANIAGDIPSKALKETGILKMLTGQDLITAEHKQHDPFDFENHAKLFFSANELPASYDDTVAFHRRWRLFDFPNSFPADDPRRDPLLLEKLTRPAELSGLLNRALAGLQRLRAKGQLTGEKKTEQKRKDYVRRSDTVKYFSLFLEQDPTAEVRVTEMYDWYIRLCHGIGKQPTNDSWFAQRLRMYVPYIEVRKRREASGDRRYRAWVGAQIQFDKLAAEGPSGPGSPGSPGISNTLYQLNLEREVGEKGENGLTAWTGRTRDCPEALQGKGAVLLRKLLMWVAAISADTEDHTATIAQIYQRAELDGYVLSQVATVLEELKRRGKVSEVSPEKYVCV